MEYAVFLRVLPLTLLLSACASTVPDVIRLAPAQAVSAQQVRKAPSHWQGALVRWGGTVLRVDNLARETRLEVLGRKLDGQGEPKTNAASDARFMARLQGFVDPTQYPLDRQVTVVGTISGILHQAVGEFPYPYPIVEVKAIHLWPEPVEAPCCPRYPWYDPWYPYWHHPYWRHPYWW